jgi:hypothetical protein
MKEVPPGSCKKVVVVYRWDKKYELTNPRIKAYAQDMVNEEKRVGKWRSESGDGQVGEEGAGRGSPRGSDGKKAPLRH